jgi:adenylate kinase
MRIVLLGAPGSGKGTQAKLLVEKYKISHIATGDLLRAAVAAGTELGRRAKAAMDAGQLVPDDVMLGVIQERLARSDTKGGFVLDGFPRNIPQAQALDALLARLGQPLQLALLIDVEMEILIKRLTGRRTCASCGQIYNVYFSPSKVAGKCDKCGGALQHRSDDNEATIRNRLQIYEAQTAPLVSYYKAQGKLRTVRGVGNINDIFRVVSDIVEAQIRPLAAAALKPAEIKPAAKPPAPPKAPPAKAPAKKKPTVKKKAAPKKKAAKKKAVKKKKAIAKKKPIKKSVKKKAAKKTARKKKGVKSKKKK